MSIKYSECVFEAIVIQHSMRMRHNVICVLFRSTIFFLIKGTIFGGRGGGGGGELLKIKLCFHFLYKVNLKHFSF